jgi:HEAT repeat protein
MTGGNGGRRGIESLIGELAHARGNPPAEAIQALVLYSEAAVEPLIATLHEIEPDEDDWTPLWITVALGEIRSPGAVPALLGFLKLPEGDVLSEAAVEALAKIGPASVPGLIDLARTARDWETRHYTYSAIGLIPGTVSLSFLTGALETDALLWSSIALALADLGDQRAIPALNRILKRCDERESPQVREAIEILSGRQPPYPRMHERPWLERYMRQTVS